MKAYTKLFIILCSFGLFNIAVADAKPFTLEEATIAAVQQAITEHRLTCVQLVNMYIDRIKKYDFVTDKAAPLNSIVNINPSVLTEAQQLDDEYAHTHQLAGPLHCVPVLLKDNIDSYDSPSTSGSLALLGSQPSQDAFVVTRLRKAGAIILGKATMDEFASGLSGISSRSGRTGNAYDPNKNSGGSSAGPAVSISANFALVAIGTDNSGSVRIPAAYNGLYSLRPSTGIISRSGIFPRGNLDGVAGPMARTVTDLAKVMNAIAVPDKRDAATESLPRPVSYTDSLNINALQGKRIGILRSVANIDQFRNTTPMTMAIYQHAINIMQQQGATIIDSITLPKFNIDRKNNMAGEVQDVNAYLAAFPSTRKDYADICNSGRAPIFGTSKECLKFINQQPKKFSRQYDNALTMFATNRAYAEQVMQANKLDALLVPIDAHGAATSAVADDSGINGLVSSNAGLPGMMIIAGYTDTKIKMPVGLELIGSAYSEAKLINMAYAFEQANPPRLPPALLTTAHPVLESMTIAELNNFFTLVGYTTYREFLSRQKANQLTAAKFQKIAQGIKA